MLTTIHEKTKGWITSVILGLITIPFALWGVNSYFQYTGGTSVATVNGKRISVAAYQNDLERQQAIVEQEMGQEFDPRVIESAGFKKQVLNSLIDQVLLDHVAASEGYRISNTDLAEYIRHAPQFRADGRFSPRLYRNFVRSKGYGVRQFEARLRELRIRQQIEVGLAAGTIVTDDDLANLVRLMGETRVISYALFGPQQFMAGLKIAPAEIKAYYEANLHQYETPEEVRVQYVEFSAAGLEKTLHPTAQQLQQSYQNNIGSYTTPEERRASHILIALPPNASAQAAAKALAKAQSIRAELLHGANFATLARKYSADTVSAARGGDLGFLTPGSLDKSFMTALFSLKKPGDISEPVRTRFGYHIIKLTAIHPAVTAPYAQVKNQVAANWRKRHAVDLYYSEADQFRNLIFEQSDSLKPAAKAYGLKIGESGWFPRSGGPGIAANAKVVAAAFDRDVLSQGHNSRGISLGSHTLLAIRDVAHRPASVRSLAAVSGQIRKVLLMKAALARAAGAESQMLQSLNPHTSLAAAAHRAGLKVIGPVTVTRNGNGDLPAALVEAAFRSADPQGSHPVYGGADLGSDGYAVFALTQVTPGSMATATKGLKDRAARILAQRRGGDYFADYLNGLRQKAKIKINRKLL